MELIKKKQFLFIFIILLFFFKFYSLLCNLKLACKDNCSDVKLKDCENSITSIEINTVDSSTDYTQYEILNNQFNCEPGDIITFSNNNNNNNGGIVCHLIIKDNNDNEIIFKASDSGNSIFSCNSFCSLSSNEFTINGETTSEKTYEYSGSNQATFEIKIPYEYAITEQTFSNLKSNGKNFKFSDFFIPTLIGAETEGRIMIKITSFENSSVNLYKNNGDTLININEEILLNENILFKPNDIETFGLFEVIFKIKVISDDSPSSTSYSIKFNVCYKYCNTCSDYSSSSPPDYRCINCIDGNYFVNDENSINLDKCYSLTDIEEHYSNYYYSSTSQKYEKCDSTCAKCSNIATECDECAIDHYFVSDKPVKQCFLKSFIEANFVNYYLP